MPKPYFHNKNDVISEILRVNHAGEYGAVRIYKGQMSVMKDQINESVNESLLKHMIEQEKQHLDYFKSAIISNKSSPTIFLPLWHIGGYFMGKISAMMGAKTAMLCTEAVEEVIDEHYRSQRQVLIDIGEIELAEKVEKFRLEELEHRDIAIEQGSKNAPVYGLVKGVIGNICKLAIRISRVI